MGYKSLVFNSLWVNYIMHSVYRTLVLVVDATPTSAPRFKDTDHVYDLNEAITSLRHQGATIAHVFSRAGRDGQVYRGNSNAWKSKADSVLHIAPEDFILFKDSELFSTSGGTERLTKDHKHPQNLPSYDTFVVLGLVTATALSDLNKCNPRSQVVVYSDLTRSPTEHHPFRNVPVTAERPSWASANGHPINWLATLAKDDITAKNLGGTGVVLLPKSEILPHPRPTGFDRFAKRLAKRLAL